MKATGRLAGLLAACAMTLLLAPAAAFAQVNANTAGSGAQAEPTDHPRGDRLPLG